jgi:aspartate racemase
MKTIGMVGGTGWVSTLEYYKLINQLVNDKLKGLNSARCILYSLNFEDIDDVFNKKNDMEGFYNIVFDAVKIVEKTGAECIVLCANTMHMLADALEKNIEIPIIHIARAAAKEIKKLKLSKVGLLGTKATMEKDFYRKNLINDNIDVIIPEHEDREFINRTIFNELLKDIMDLKSKKRLLEIIYKLKSQGAEGIVLGCTEIPLIIKQEDVDIPLIDTLTCHVNAIVDFSIG